MEQETLDLGLDFALPLPRTEPFTAQMALRAGVSRPRLRSLVDAGVLRRALRGVYIDAAVPDSLELRAACLRLVVPEDAVVVDRHAGWLLGAEMILAPGEHVESRPVSMFRPLGRGRIRQPLSHGGERLLTDEDVIESAGLRVTTPLRTACDLGRVRWADEAIAGVDAMLRLGAFSKAELVESVERFTGYRWVTTLRAVAALADGRSESPGESVLRLRCVENGLRMTPQVRVYDHERVIARLDLANEELLVAAEYDGVEWHSSPSQQAHDRRRRDDLAGRGWDIEPLGKELVFGRARECDRVLRQLWERGKRRRRALAS